MSTLPIPSFTTDWAAHLDEQLDDFLHTGVAIIDDCFDKQAVSALQAESGYINYKEAHLTHGERAATIRGDSIRWIDDGCPIGMNYLASINELAQYFNQTLYAGIRRSEAHFARYPAGFGYQWHKDNPAGRDERVISAVYYLNDDWTDSDGGEILVVDKLGNEQKLLPQANRLVLFDSNLLHQVNITHRTRFSIATWMRRDDDVL
ncbi:2OG-Fe(II) oxygenase [Moraxella sp. FZFQ2102]|uniref:2OG-Fe(II) oxygenase n=1 Tax=Moraxella sp. FZFQ2102 TaxID=2953752 RepID=UPI00209BFE86|nr:2OG-Fe(II) oxygenase [Moraxella sp. FZFQ2102]USZ14232.1 2OG-Fe(II) oxygenase [Moraxella sp. FZFQ2102]